MLITCPNCGTNFSIPDAALGTTGRKLKCAKCGHKWFQEPLMVMDEDDTDLDLSGPSFSSPSAFSAPPPMAEPDYRREPSFDEPPRMSSGSASSDLDDIDLDSPPIPNFGSRIKPEHNDDDRSADSLLDDGPQPIPDVFSTASPEGKKGTGFLWVLLVLLVLGGLGGAAYYFQDMLVEAVPEAGELMSQAGLRHEKPGAGLELRKAGTPERFVHNDTDVLVVRGIIANITDRVRPVPTMKLVLMDKNKQPVQEKLSQPPVSALDPQGTASFKIMLERPDPNAVEVVVVFVESGEAKMAAPPPAPKPLAPPTTPDVAPAPAPAPAPVAAPAPAVAPAPAAPAEAKPEAK
jgi:predicted Zn finger-like uncharacterized protein